MIHEKSDAITLVMNTNSNLNTVSTLELLCVSPTNVTTKKTPTIRNPTEGLVIYRPASVDEFTPGVWTFYLHVIYSDGKSTYSDAAKVNFSKIGS